MHFSFLPAASPPHKCFFHPSVRMNINSLGIQSPMKICIAYCTLIVVLHSYTSISQNIKWNQTLQNQTKRKHNPRIEIRITITLQPCCLWIAISWNFASRNTRNMSMFLLCTLCYLALEKCTIFKNKKISFDNWKEHITFMKK